MRIGLMIYGGLDEVSGGFLYDRMLVESLRKAGDRVRAAVLAWRPYAGHLLDNVDPAVGDRVLQPRADLLLQDELIHPSVFRWNDRARARGGVPLVAIVHHLRSLEAHPGWLQPLYRAVEGRYLRSVDGFVFNSRASREAVRSALGHRPRGVVAYPGVDHMRPFPPWRTLAPRAESGGPLRVLFVGNLIPRKRPVDLLRALAGVPPGEWELTIVGYHAEVYRGHAAALRRQAMAMGSAAQIRFAGGLNRRYLRQELHRAHVLAIPSDYEGFGLAYLEAMAFGLVPIATDRGGAPELIRDEYNGFLVPPRQPEILQDRLARLASDRRRLARMSFAAWRTARSWPSWVESGEKVQRFLHGLSPHRRLS